MNPTDESRDPSPNNAPSPEKQAGPSSADVASETTVLAGTRPSDPKPATGDLVRLAAKARLLERLVTGDVRVLATELREDLEAMCGPVAAVVDIASGRPPR